MRRSPPSPVTWPPLSEIRDWLARLIAELRPSPALPQRDIDRLGFALDALTPAVFQSSLPAQALHGDVSMGNLLRTDRGLLWNDFEDVCAGPVAWDVAGLVASATARGHGARFMEELLAGYGELDAEGLEPFLEAHAMYEIVWRAFAAPRRQEGYARSRAD
jgi:Ser/Thr protein kinase RdoA (MazF antagonist)